MIDNLEQRVSNKLYNKWPITKIAEAANLIVMGHMFSHMQPVLAKSRPNFRTAHDGPSARHACVIFSFGNLVERWAAIAS